MSKSGSTLDRTELRKQITSVASNDADAPPRAVVVTQVVDAMGCTEEAVHNEIDTLERHGFVYLVGDDQQVKVP